MKAPIALHFAAIAAAFAAVISSRADEVGTIVLSNGVIRAEIVPAWAGRLMSFGRPGGANLLWTQPEAAGFGLHPDGRPRWKNIGGEKTWVGSDGAAWRAFEGLEGETGNVWPPPKWFDSMPMRIVESSPTGAVLRTGAHRGGDWIVALEREFALEADALVVRSRLLAEAFGARGRDALPDDDRRLWSIAQIPLPEFVMVRLCGEGRHVGFGDISSPEPAGSGRWARIALPESDAARKVSADGDALAVRLPDGDGWLLMEQTAPARCLSTFATPGRAMVYASPVGFRPSAYAELEFAAYGPDAEHTVRFSLSRELPGASATTSASASGPPPTAPILGTAVRGRGGAVFTVPAMGRTVWANVEWVTAGGETNTAWRHLHLYGDGKERRYFFDGAAPVRWGANYPNGIPADKWSGDIVSFRVVNDKTKEEVPVRDLRIVPDNPRLPPELILSHTKVPMALDRAGRPVDVEVGVFNVGTVAATGVTVRIEGLPEGVRLADADAAGRLRDLGGGDSVLHRATVVADAPCAFTARLVFSGGNAPEAVAEVPVRIGPSLGLPQDLPYIPEPTPIATAPCEVGAFYFPDWARAHHWLKVWRFAPERRPALGWYSNDDPEVLDWQIKWAVENGISFFLVDWYGKDWHFEKALAGAKFARNIKFANMWCNHLPPPECDEAHWTNVIRRCLEKDFRHPSYKYVDGKPYFCVWSGDRLERDNGPGGCRRMLDLARTMARDAGYAGIYFVGQCLGYSNEVRRMADYGFDETTTYHYVEVPAGPDGTIPWVREYDDVVAASPAYWRAMRAAGPAAVLPNLTTGYLDHPWQDTPIEVRDRSVEAFRRLCREARRYAEETGAKRVCLGPLNEWGEGSYAEPNGEFGFGMYEAVRDVFGVKPEGGWPTNYVPADIGRGPYPVEDDDGGPVHPFNGLRWR